MAVITEPEEHEAEELDDRPLVVPERIQDEPRDQRERAWHEWMGIAVALSALLSILAIIISVAALGSSGTTKTLIASAPSSSPAAAVPAVPTEAIGMSIKADDEHGKRGPDGQWHDAFLPANVTVHAGDRVTITFTNYDGGPHSFTSPSLGVNQVINGGGSLTNPQVVKVTFTAPKQPGSYAWWCSTPCDPWAMKHAGYMRGFVTVRA